MLLTNDEAKNKCCPFTLNIPQAKAGQNEYKCLGDQCMAWVYKIIDEEKGYCELIEKDVVNLLKRNG